MKKKMIGMIKRRKRKRTRGRGKIKRRIKEMKNGEKWPKILEEKRGSDVEREKQQQ